MKAGRELDALVAEKVMGFKWDDERCPVCGWPYAEGFQLGCAPGNCSERPVPTRRADEPPPYSASVREASAVITRIIGTPLFLPWITYIEDTNFAIKSEAEQAHIICLAALKAVGVEV